MQRSRQPMKELVIEMIYGFNHRHLQDNKEISLKTAVETYHGKYTYGSASIFLRLVEWMIKAIFCARGRLLD